MEQFLISQKQMEMNNIQLNESLQKSDFVTDTIMQIEKDFSRCNIALDFQGIHDRNSIEDCILNALKILPNDKLQQLIYIIDIPENEFLKIVGNQFFLVALSEKILRREALKVYLKRALSDKNNPS